MSLVIILITVFVLGFIFKGLVSTLIGIPLIIHEKITDYKRNELDSKEIKQWKWVFLLFGIAVILYGFASLIFIKS